MPKYFDYDVLCIMEVRGALRDVQRDTRRSVKVTRRANDDAISGLTAALQKFLDKHFDVRKTVEHSGESTWTAKVQHEFSEDEVHQAEEGDEGDLDPTDKALSALGLQIHERLSSEFDVVNVEAWADFDDLLGFGELD